MPPGPSGESAPSLAEPVPKRGYASPRDATATQIAEQQPLKPRATANTAQVRVVAYYAPRVYK